MYRSLVCYTGLLLCFAWQVRCTVRQYSSEEQQAFIEAAATDCLTQIFQSTASSTPPALEGPSSCPMTFDGIACWPSTPARHNATIPCPYYISLFDSQETATWYCTEAGTWETNSKNRSIGNYFECYAKTRNFSDSDDDDLGFEFHRNLTYLGNIYTIGITISITASLLSLALFSYFRKLLQCCRNVIHVNMYISFILRGVFTLVLFFAVSPYGNNPEPPLAEGATMLSTQLNNTPSNWECKLGTTLWMYTRISNYSWIFMEALYLHLLMFVFTFNDKQYKYRIIVAGWALPLLFLIPWVGAKAAVDDHKCWLGIKNNNIRWIVEAPILLIVLVNFGFFINLVKLLASKLNTSEVNGYNQKTGRRLARSAFVIIPLFGVHYLIFLYADFHPNVYANTTLMWIGMYADAIFTSFQGLVVAILFCFLNSEVKGEIQKIWIKIKFRHKCFSSKRLRQRQRRSVSSDTAVTYASRSNSNTTGLLTVSLASESRSASLRRGVSIPSAINEEEHKLIAIGDNCAVNQNPNQACTNELP